MQQTTEKLTADPMEDRPSVPSVASVPFDAADQLDRLTVENERLRYDLRLRSARDTLVSALVGERARSPELLFDASVSRFAFDDAGALVNADALISELQQKFPEQFETDKAPLLPEEGWTRNAAGVVGGSAPNIHAGAGRNDDRPLLTPERLSQMTPQEIALLDWNDVKQVLSA